MDTTQKGARVRGVLPLIVTAVALLLAAGTAQADDVFVDCDAAPGTLSPPTYPTINAALSVLSLQGPHSITITGTCVEQVGIDNRSSLTLQAPEGQRAIIAHPPTEQRAATVRIHRSQNITLRQLTIRDGSSGIRVREASEAVLQDIIVENNLGPGLFVGPSAHADVPGPFISRQNTGQGVNIGTNSAVDCFRGPTTIENNGGSGMQVGPSADVCMGGDSGNVPVRISGNGGSGINVTNGSVARIFGDAIVEDHPNGVAINVSNSQVVMNARLFPNILRNAMFGMNILDVSSAFVNGNNMIQNNTSIGVQVGAFSMARFNQAGPAGSVVGAVIEGNGGLGFNIAGDGQVFFFGPHKIRNNGAAPVSPELRGGIRLNRATLSLRRDVEISGNTGPGILVDFDGAIQVGFTGEPPSNVMITGNSEEGIRLLRNSRAWFANAGSVSGNGLNNLTCDSTSWLFGDLTGVSTHKCTNTDVEKVPKK